MSTELNSLVPITLDYRAGGHYLEPYIRNWGKASAGKDMMVQQGPNLKTGFRDPTIIRR